MAGKVQNRRSEIIQSFQMSCLHKVVAKSLTACCAATVGLHVVLDLVPFAPD